MALSVKRRRLSIVSAASEKLLDQVQPPMEIRIDEPKGLDRAGHLTQPPRRWRSRRERLVRRRAARWLALQRRRDLLQGAFKQRDRRSAETHADRVRMTRGVYDKQLAPGNEHLLSP
jgi:hypothetical protein